MVKVMFRCYLCILQMLVLYENKHTAMRRENSAKPAHKFANSQETFQMIQMC